MPKTLIQHYREAAGMSRRQLGLAIGCSAAQIWRLEHWDSDDPDNKDARRPKWRDMVRIADALGIDVASLEAPAPGETPGDEVEPIEGGPHAAIYQRHGLRSYRVLKTALADLGLVPGQHIVVNETATPKTGDVVLVSIADAEGVGPVKALLQFAGPSLLHTNKPGRNTAFRLDDKAFRVVVLGVLENPG